MNSNLKKYLPKVELDLDDFKIHKSKTEMMLKRLQETIKAHDEQKQCLASEDMIQGLKFNLNRMVADIELIKK